MSKPTEEIAEAIAQDLFTTVSGDMAIRLQLKLRDWIDGVRVESDGGGWSIDEVAARINKILEDTEREA